MVTVAVTGSPIIDGAIAWMDCTTAEVVDAGDHYFVMGLVVAMDHADEESQPAPLLFFRGQLGRLRGADMNRRVGIAAVADIVCHRRVRRDRSQQPRRR